MNEKEQVGKTPDNNEQEKDAKNGYKNILHNHIICIAIMAILVIAIYVSFSMCGFPKPNLDCDKCNNKPNIEFFDINPTSINQCQKANLSWDVTGAGDVIILPDIGKKMSKGSEIIFPRNTTNYTLTAYNTAGNASTSISIEVKRHIINAMDLVWNSFSSSINHKPKLRINQGMTGNALNMSYNLMDHQFESMSTRVSPDKLSRTNGIKFNYKSSSDPNKTIEVKLEDNNGNNFVSQMDVATSPENWSVFEKKYSEFYCLYGPCTPNGRSFDLNKDSRNISKLTISVIRANGMPGEGWILIDQIYGDACE